MNLVTILYIAEKTWESKTGLPEKLYDLLLLKTLNCHTRTRKQIFYDSIVYCKLKNVKHS